MTTLRTVLAAAAVVGLVGVGAVLHPGATAVQASPAVAPAALTDSSIPDVAERVFDSVVNISTSHAVETGPASFDPFFTNPFSPGFGAPSDRMAMAKGSGVIVTASGRILTNAHVVKDASDIRWSGSIPRWTSRCCSSRASCPRSRRSRSATRQRSASARSCSRSAIRSALASR
jgi:S1-C subfamily serine protease